MLEQYFYIDFNPERTLQDQIREHLVGLILSSKLPLEEPLPSTRNLAEKLGVSRNTIISVYEKMIDSGFIETRARKGFFITKGYHTPELVNIENPPPSPSTPANWLSRIRKKPSNEANIIKPNNWQSFEYPFIYGQVQKDTFPMEQWRDAVRKSMKGKGEQHWVNDMIDSDDPMLIEQIRTRLLPRRGIYAQSSEIIITIGTQNSLYLLANLLCDQSTKLAMENPGFRDAFNIFNLFGCDIHKQDIDEDGIIVDEQLTSCDCLYITPSNQAPTGVELTVERRKALMKMSAENDFFIIEDDYDAEINTTKNPLPALKATDINDRVIYVGSMSKSISPGLRVGFIVADEELIGEIRALRRLMYRHPPANTQRQLALFMSLGYYDNYLRKLRHLNTTKQQYMLAAIEKHLPQMLQIRQGATSIWIEAPTHINTEEVAWLANKKSILIEPGAIHFLTHEPPKHFFRLGFSAIEAEKIDLGVEALSNIFAHF